MATRLKPSRINVDNVPHVWDGAAYKTDDDFHWSLWGGDMSYADFERKTLTWSSVTIEDPSNNITPTSNFTVSAGTVKPGIEYILRVNTWNTPYTMTLWTWITNPSWYNTVLKENTVNQFKFIATSTNQLELEWVDERFVTTNTNQTISGRKTFTTEPVLPNKTSDATNDWTKPATEAQVYKKANKVSSATEDHLASLTSTGDLADSGIAKSTVELNTNKETGDAPTDSTSKYPSSHTVKKYVDDQVSAATAGAVSNEVYDATTWDGVNWIAPSKNAVRDKIVTMDSNISTNTTDISTINGKIPSEASTSNQLADKAYVWDSINSVTAYYITKDANGNQFATYAELAAATTFYSGWVQRTPTRNDYTIVLADENYSNATTRYIYNSGWEYQYTVNETALTQAQLDALNSWITSWKVTTYDGYAAGKQDTLTLPSSVVSGNAVVFGVNNKTLNDAGAAPVLVSGNQTINWTKTFGTSPVVPSKTSDATNTGTAIATEAQVYKKQDALVNQTNIKSVNWNNLLWSWNIVLFSAIQVTLAAASWSSEEITVTATWVTASNHVIVSPDPSSITDYADALVYCSNQASNSLTFKCTTAPENDMTVNVLIIN